MIAESTTRPRLTAPPSATFAVGPSARPLRAISSPPDANGQLCDAVLLRQGLTWPVGQGATHGAGNRVPRLGKIRRNQLVGNGRATDNVALPFPSRRWRARREWEVDALSPQTLNAGATPRRGIPGPGNSGAFFANGGGWSYTRSIGYPFSSSSEMTAAAGVELGKRGRLLGGLAQ